MTTQPVIAPEVGRIVPVGVPTPPSIKRQKKLSLFDRSILRRALADSFVKLNPRKMMKNPVMFLVEVGALLTTVLLIPGLAKTVDYLFQTQITFWLWATVLFANFAEAVAEGRGKAQADALRKAKIETVARRLVGPALSRPGPTKSRPYVEERVP